ncbi:beta/gamma crystallin-related protein [Gimesia fumaroli]|uniref:Beta/Gamma crystallin n=1 Tax=Gimesia fumaroli TaxID=2527976 RepID=A0A518IEM0_9PLAN|nr:beta/gamma crystallin-related protein [Gimesia fumaroli]QDV51551.1 Beta/Gamma crystallin [Gimesia fumaroli]
MTTDLPISDLSSGNGCIPDLLDFDPPKPIQPLGTLTHSDNQTRGDYASAGADTLSLPQVQIYQHIDFGGRSAITSLNWRYVGDWWNDKISSIVIYRGRWRFYQHSEYRGAYWDLGVGQYRWVEDANIPNDIISSFKFIGY